MKLFFSDHCECAKVIRPEEVVRKVAVEFFCLDGKAKDPDAEFFVRQKYNSVADDIHFSTLSQEDLSPETPCPCRARRMTPFSIGDFVLVVDDDRLQPHRFEGYKNTMARVRDLPRRIELDESSVTGVTELPRVNELVWTDKIIAVPVKKVARTCHVVRIDENQEVPDILQWANGSSDWFFFRSAAKVVESIEPAEGNSDMEITDISTRSTSPERVSKIPTRSASEAPTDILEAVKPAEVSVNPLAEIPENQKLRGLDLFCGGGNFGRGVSDGGAVHHKWYSFSNAPKERAVDIEINALHTYRANLEHDDMKLYLGSINNFLFDVIIGRRKSLPKQGEIDFILAGSPCQGFSTANPQGHEVLKSLSNSALICTTISAIDFYRPKYAILENVPAMASDRQYRGQQVNVSNQIMCALIGMGYQCRCLLLDAWSFGTPQSRTRLFIEIAAPGCALPEIPQPSHAHPTSIKSRSVGKTATNIKFASRELDLLTPFPAIKTSDIWDDLPDIGNGHLGVCIPYPEHRVYFHQNARYRRLTALIPHVDVLGSGVDCRHPGYQYALRRNLIPEHLARWPKINKKDMRLQRLNPAGLVPTVTCIQVPISPVCGRTMHYSQDRPMTNMEVKRAQGFLDSDVLIGKAKRMYRIIGNSVCRQVAFALGLKLAEAVRKGPIGSGVGVPVAVKEEIQIKDETERLLGSRKFMVLIENTKKLSLLHGSEKEGMISDGISVRYSVTNGTEKVEVSMPLESRKRIRIEVEGAGDESGG
jgi:DNA (cytosine-5)-methyltransferase 1